MQEQNSKNFDKNRKEKKKKIIKYVTKSKGECAYVFVEQRSQK